MIFYSDSPFLLHLPSFILQVRILRIHRIYNSGYIRHTICLYCMFEYGKEAKKSEMEKGKANRENQVMEIYEKSKRDTHR